MSRAKLLTDRRTQIEAAVDAAWDRYAIAAAVVLRCHAMAVASAGWITAAPYDPPASVLADLERAERDYTLACEAMEEFETRRRRTRR